MLDIWSRKCS